MVTLGRYVVAPAPLLFAAVVLWSSSAFAQINVRGYLDLHQNGPLELAGDRGFTLRAGLDPSEDNLPFYTCNGDPINCAPGKTFHAMTVSNPQSGIATLDGVTYHVGGFSGTGRLSVTFEGSVVLPPIAPTAVVTTSFTFSGTFGHAASNGGSWTTESLAGGGLVDVYLHSPGDPNSPNSWYVDRIVYRFDQAPLPGRWTYADIGAVGQPGQSRFSNGDFILNGSGADIWGAADAFQYLYSTLEGDGSVSVRVMSLSAAHTFAKAGVMLRQSGDPGAAHVILDVRPNGSVEFMTRSTTGGSTSYIDGTTVSFPVWLRLQRKAGTVSALTSADARSWQTVGSISIGSWGWPMAGMAVTSHDNSTSAQGVFEEPSIGLDWPWQHTDVGSMTRFDANAEFIHQSYVVSGTGADIWGNADAFHFLYQPRHGDGLIVARVDGEEDTNPFAKAGVMIRQTTGAGSTHVILDVCPNGNVEFMARTVTGGSTTYLGGTTRAFPVWVKLERHGAAITGFTSADGSAWAAVGSIELPMAPIADFGVAVTSHDTSLLNTARIGTLYVQSSPGPANPPPSAPPNVVIYASDVAASAMHGVWAAASDSTSPNGTKLTTPVGGAPNISAPLASPADYLDIPFATATNTPYTLWIRVRAANNSKYSDSLWVQFSDAQAGGGVYPIGTTSGLMVNLATDTGAASLQNWGWTDGAYWLSQPATFTFSTTTHTMRIQPREYGVQIDQIVLSPSTYLNPNASCPTSCGSAPGPVSNDSTIVVKP